VVRAPQELVAESRKLFVRKVVGRHMVWVEAGWEWVEDGLRTGWERQRSVGDVSGEGATQSNEQRSGVLRLADRVLCEREDCGAISDFLVTRA
jgi:hypothetical protein